MSGQPTRAGLPPAATDRRRWVPAPASWRQWARFVRRPVLPDRADTGVAGGLRAVLPLLGLDLALMALLLGAIGAAFALGFEMPKHMLGGMKLTPMLIAMFVVVLPVGEEIAFRGWLSGRPGHIAGSVAFAAALGMLAMASRNADDPAAVHWSFGALAAVLAAALVVFLLRGRPPLQWFQRHFTWFFWASALGFAAVHLTNFAAAGPAMLPLVLPQFALALILGYLRVTRGLWTSMLLHMLHNGVFVAVMLAGSS